jgi:hypothetical protein
MNNQRRVREFSKLNIAQQALASLLALLLLAAYPRLLVAQDQQAAAEAPPGVSYVHQTPEQLKQLVG